MKKKKGYILISTLVILSLLIVLTFFLADALFSELSIARNQKAATVCFNLAEAGIQEAVWRLANDPGTKDKFLNSIDGQTQFSHGKPALVSDGYYDVTIQNTALAAATITATGYFDFGSKTAQRRIVVNVTKAPTPPPYAYDGAIFTGGSTGEEDITLTTTTMNITGGGSLISNRDIWFTRSTINVENDIIAKRTIRNQLSTVSAGGIISENDAGTYTFPALDVTSDCPIDPAQPKSYKCLAQQQVPPQYYTSKQFDDMLKAAGNLTLNGIVYVAGNGINIDSGRSVTVNGILVSEGAVDVGGPSKRGVLTINHVDGHPSGLVSLSKFTAWANSEINVTGLFYIGDRFSFDPSYDLNPESETINITGGVLARRFEGRGSRTLNIAFNAALINEALLPDPDDTPIIQFEHWEEEY